MILSTQTQWLSLSSRLGIDGHDQWKKLDQAYSESGLAYHNLHHIADCLAKFSSRKHEALDPTSVELAIWFHDIIYDPRASDNEEQSAQLAFNFLSSTPHAKTVSDLILATKHTAPPAYHDAQLICDIDLSILGSPPASYQKYAAAIRQEYSFVAESDYKKGRSKVLQNFLNRPTIFTLAPSRDLYESHARQNLQSEIQDLSKHPLLSIKP